MEMGEYHLMMSRLSSRKENCQKAIAATSSKLLGAVDGGQTPLSESMPRLSLRHVTQIRALSSSWYWARRHRCLLKEGLNFGLHGLSSLSQLCSRASYADSCQESLLRFSEISKLSSREFLHKVCQDWVHIWRGRTAAHSWVQVTRWPIK